MAKAKKTDLNKVLLAVVAATTSNTPFFVNREAVKELEDQELIQFHPDNVQNEHGETQCIATDKGIEQMNAPAVKTEVAAPVVVDIKPSFSIVTGVDLPQGFGRSVTRPETYPWSKLAEAPVGAAFFVPSKTMKALTSSVSGANAKYESAGVRFKAVAIADGAAYGSEYAGQSGVAVYKVEFSERVRRASRKQAVAA